MNYEIIFYLKGNFNNNNNNKGEFGEILNRLNNFKRN